MGTKGALYTIRAYTLTNNGVPKEVPTYCGLTPDYDYMARTAQTWANMRGHLVRVVDDTGRILTTCTPKGESDGKSF